MYINSVYIYSDLPVRVSTNLPESGSQGGRESWTSELIGLRPRWSETNMLLIPGNSGGTWEPSSKKIFEFKENFEQIT